MITTDELLRETFAAEATTITMPLGTRARIEQLGRRYRARRTAMITGAAVAAIAVAVAVPAVATSFDATRVDQPAAAAPASYESWSPRGALARDSGFTAGAVAAWDATSSSAPHTDIQVLWAGVFPTGRGAVLVGHDTSGDRRIAVVAGAGQALHVLRDVPAPAGLSHLSFNLFTDDEDHANYLDVLVVVTPPASGWTVQWTGGPDAADGAGTVATEDGIALVDISQSGPHGQPTIRLLDGSAVVYEGPIGSLS